MIYLDNASTTKVNEEVVETIVTMLKKHWFNPSGLYSGSLEAKKILDEARETCAKSINAKPEEIIFTSSGSESNNLAISGYLNSHDDYALITDRFEHSSVRNIKSFKYRISNNNKGIISLVSLQECCLNLYKTFSKKPLVSIVGANNEIGTIQNIKKISEIVHNHNGILHVDGVQLFPDMKIDVQELGIDMLSVSGHKIHAPAGCGFLYVKSGISISPIISGEQERGLRGGTENLAYICGMSKAIESLDYSVNEHIKNLRDYAIMKFLKIPNTCLVGSLNNRLSNNINICFKNIDAQDLVVRLGLFDICCNTGSACNTFSYEPSHVLKALGMSDKEALSCVRFSLNEEITKKDIDYVYERILSSIKSINSAEWRKDNEI